MNEDKSETTGQRTDDPMLDHACTMRIALAIARRQNELDLRLHRIEQALKLGGHANFPSTDRNQPTTQKNKERTDNGRNTVDHDRIHVRARREEHHRGPFQSQRDHLLAQDQHRRKLDPHPIHDPEHTVIDPADPAAGKTLAKAVEGWERAGGLHTARAAGTSHLAANQPPEEYAYRWRKPGDPDRHIAYLSTAFDRDQAMKARENAGYVVTKVDEDPAVLYEQHRKASCMRASHILERYESPDQDAVRILHGIVGEVNAHDPENDIATYLAYPSDKAVQIAGDGLTSADIAEKREMGGWDPRKDPLMRINAQGDWTGITQQQADQIVWDNRDEILTRASYDSELSTWTLHQLDQLKEPQPTQSLDRDRPEPDHKAPAQADSTTKRHGPRL